ncbi:hypothetical protein VTG60DRAFT_3308 [Thermothelomyces hinnuleus]
MENPDRLRELAREVQTAVDALISSDNIANYKALQTSLRRLQVAATKPADTVFSFRCQMIENASISMLLEMGILDALVAGQGSPRTAAELAAATETDESLVVRLMRVACGLHFCDETDEATYRATPITHLLVAPGYRGGLKWAESFYPIVPSIPRFLSSTDFRRTGGDPTQTAFQFTHGKTAWEFLKEHPDVRQGFDLWMHERRKHEERSWHKRFPPSSALSPADLRTDPDAVLLVDVGGATGSQVADFRAQFPHLPGRCVLQDIQPPPEGSVEGVEIMTYDFFTPQPIKGARFYYFRTVFHNWSDEKAAEILRNVVEAMDPDYSTLLIDDYVLPARHVQLRGSVEDILMLAVLNSLERTAKQYENLLSVAGLEIVNIYEVGPNEEAVIEAKVAKRTA